MQRRAPSVTNALLQKVNSQLKGERIKKPEDELDVSIPLNIGERGGSVVECRTPEREVGGSKPTAAVLCP